MATTPDRHDAVYECAGALFRVNGRVECMIGGEWLPSHFTLNALKEAGARKLDGEELQRMRARLDA